ncbi:MAG: DHCW motif cupin fold protein [Melioribacteraceae bacterium]
MKIQNVPFNVVDWNRIIPKEYPGETGMALWKVFEAGNVRVRIVEYSPGYLADHWCARGHVIYILEGELITELKDGRIFKLTPGMSYQVADDNEPHRSRTETGAKLFVVD